MTTLKFTELRPVLMVDAVLQGRVDAACLEDPELSAGRPRVRVIGDGEDAIGKLFLETGWFSTRDWLAKNQDAARRFRDAVAAAGVWAMANPDAAGLVLQNDLHVKQTHATQRFATRMNLADIQLLLDAAAMYKIINPIAATSMVWTG